MMIMGLSACQPHAVQPALAPQTRTATAATDIYPLDVGTTWSYRLTQFKNGQPTGRVDTMGSRVLSATDTAGGRIAKVERTYGTMTLPPTQATRTAEGIILARWPEGSGQESLPLNRGRLGGSQPAGGSIERFLPQPEAVRQGTAKQPTTENELTVELKILTLPLAQGDSWTGRVWTFAKETLTAQGWEQVTVPAGSYRAWHVTHRLAYDDGRSDHLAYWYAPGVGMIKAHEENTMVMNGQTVRYSVDGELTTHSKER
jgi:hypothetical protein